MYQMNIYYGMITTTKLVNTIITSHLYHLTLFVCMWGSQEITLEIYILSKFQVYNTILLTAVTMLYIIFPRTYPSYKWKSVPSNKHLPIFPSLPVLATTMLLSVSMNLTFLDSHISEIIQYSLLSVCLSLAYHT